MVSEPIRLSINMRQLYQVPWTVDPKGKPDPLVSKVAESQATFSMVSMVSMWERGGGGINNQRKKRPDKHCSQMQCSQMGCFFQTLVPILTFLEKLVRKWSGFRFKSPYFTKIGTTIPWMLCKTQKVENFYKSPVKV